uniref:Glycosyltransferase n=1 Tax=Crocosmia x crocosmiiflora TaxID=1053288 RepID=A0A7H1JNH2_CROXC|nr:flavonol glycoside 4'-O-xylosyltransferase [Crocosmia x crocosmiiflora]
MASETSPTLHILFFPLMAPSHMLPVHDMAKLFAARSGVNCTFLTTHGNAHLVKPHPAIKLQLIPFPPDSGLPAGCENQSTVPCQDLEPNFFAALSKLRQPFDVVLRELHPDCVITDAFFPWTYDIAAELDIPRLVFHVSNNFSRCAFDALDRHKVFQDLPSEEESFVIPGLPHRIEMLKTYMPDPREMHPVFFELIPQMMEAEPKSYGVVTNSVYELEPDYVDYSRNVIGRKTWCFGPVSLCNSRGDVGVATNPTCLNWLDSMSPRSVVYVSFGSLSHFSKSQLTEIALGLEASDQPFLWVLREADEEWMIDGYEQRTKGKGLIIRGWAPQVQILNHKAIGGFVTHCGWNSSLEGICAGLPLVTWPLFAEQFFNERFILDVLKIGVAVGIKEHTIKHVERPVIEAGKVEKAVRLLMGDGEETVERWGRVRELGEMAKKAVEIDGSSYNDMESLIKELKESQKTK